MNNYTLIALKRNSDSTLDKYSIETESFEKLTKVLQNAILQGYRTINITTKTVKISPIIAFKYINYFKSIKPSFEFIIGDLDKEDSQEALSLFDTIYTLRYDKNLPDEINLDATYFYLTIKNPNSIFIDFIEKYSNE